MAQHLRNLIFLLGFTLLLPSLPATAQKKEHSPKKAGILSAVLPGLGLHRLLVLVHAAG